MNETRRGRPGRSLEPVMTIEPWPIVDGTYSYPNCNCPVCEKKQSEINYTSFDNNSEFNYASDGTYSGFDGLGDDCRESSSDLYTSDDNCSEFDYSSDEFQN